MNNIYKILLIFCATFNFFSTLICQDDQTTQYLIYTSEELKEAGNLLSDFYNNPNNYINNGFHNPDSIKLSTVVITANDIINNNPSNTEINASNISTYLHKYLYDVFENNNCQFTNLSYLLIIGDEIIIEPFLYLAQVPSDDYISNCTTHGTTLNSNYLPLPSLRTGRILTDNLEEARLIVNNIIDYIKAPHRGNWKNEALLFCDNQYNPAREVYQEIEHTEFSDILYDRFKKQLSITCLYGTEYTTQQSSDWYLQSELNNDIIYRINQGVSFINYIGHGTSEILADEDILTFSDLNLISINNNKLPIWVVATCSFGNYLNQNCFAEKLLKKGNAAIGIISTTHALTFDDNWEFIDNFYTNLSSYINQDQSLLNQGLNLSNNKRLGDIFFNAKKNTFNTPITQYNSNDTYKFHLFGDPAMPINISKINSSSNPILNEISQLEIGLNNIVGVNSPYIDSLSTLKILSEDNISKIFFNDVDENLDSLEYNLPGNILYFGVDSLSQNFNDIMLPIDVDASNSANILIHNDYNNTVEFIDDINLNLNLDIISEDNPMGPNITIAHKGKVLSNNSIIYPPFKITIFINDNENPINVSGLGGHDIRLWFDDNDHQSIILNTFYNPLLGSIEEYSIEEYFTEQPHTITVQAYDVLNYPGEKKLENIWFHANEQIYNVYNFPNPFSNKTYFTFHCSEELLLDITIKIFSTKGQQIKEINKYGEYANDYTFYRVSESWDGYDNKGSKVPNGTYFYNLFIYLNSNRELIHQDTYKLTKIE